MRALDILIIGGGIGGLTSAIALGRAGHRVTIVERDPDWAVYGVGIIQQSNVVRAMDQLGLLDEYVEAGFGFDQVEVLVPSGARVATIDSPRLVEGYPANIGIGLVPLSETLMYMYVTTPEPDNPRYPVEGLAAAMRAKLAGAPPAIAALAEQITDDRAVVYKPLEWLFLEGDWHKGRIVLLGDAVHATTPHLGQGGGMAIEDSVVLAEELARADDLDTAFQAFRHRRFERCRYIVEQSRAISYGQTGRGPRVEQGAATHAMTQFVANPI